MHRITNRLVIGTVRELLDADMVTGMFISNDELDDEIVWLDDKNGGYTSWPLWKLVELLELSMEW